MTLLGKKKQGRRERVHKEDEERPIDRRVRVRNPLMENEGVTEGGITDIQYKRKLAEP